MLLPEEEVFGRALSTKRVLLKMTCRAVGKALLKLSLDGINEMVPTLPPGVARFTNLQPKIKTMQGIQTSSSSSSSGEGNGPVEFCG